MSNLQTVLDSLDLAIARIEIINADLRKIKDGNNELHTGLDTDTPDGSPKPTTPAGN
jgi:hypothetical protein